MGAVPSLSGISKNRSARFAVSPGYPDLPPSGTLVA
jgi:hypothetical protein